MAEFPSSENKDEDIDVEWDDPEQHVRVLREYHDSEESLPFDLTLILRVYNPSKLNWFIRQHYGVKSLKMIPSNPTSFEELKRRDKCVLARNWFFDDFSTYPEYAIVDSGHAVDDHFFATNICEKMTQSPEKNVDNDSNYGREWEKSLDDQDIFFEAFGNDFKVCTSCELSDLSITVSGFNTQSSQGIDSYQELENVEENDGKIISLTDDVDEYNELLSFESSPPMLNKLIRPRTASLTTVSSLTTLSADSSVSRYYDANWYYHADSRFDSNGMTPGYDPSLTHVGDSAINNYTLMNLIAKARSLIQEQKGRPELSSGSKTVEEKRVALARAHEVIRTLQEDSLSSAPSIDETTISSKDVSDRFVSFEQEISLASDVSDVSAKISGSQDTKVKELLRRIRSSLPPEF